jgi:hypothetical protein
VKARVPEQEEILNPGASVSYKASDIDLASPKVTSILIDKGFDAGEILEFHKEARLGLRYALNNLLNRRFQRIKGKQNWDTHDPLKQEAVNLGVEEVLSALPKTKTEGGKLMSFGAALTIPIIENSDLDDDTKRRLRMLSIGVMGIGVGMAMTSKMKEFQAITKAKILADMMKGNKDPEASLRDIMQSADAKEFTPTELAEIEKSVKDPEVMQRIEEFRATTKIAHDPRSAVDQVLDYLENVAKPAQRKQKAIYTSERAQKTAKAAKAMEAGGEEAYKGILASLKGKFSKAPIESIGNVHPEINAYKGALYDMIWKSNADFYDKVGAAEGLTRAFKGEQIRKSERAKMEAIFGKAFVDAPTNPKYNWKMMMLDAISLPRMLMASFDMSFPLRQGLWLSTRHPLIAAKSFPEMHKAFFSESAYKAIEEKIATSPNAEWYEKFDIGLVDIDHASSNILKREEMFVGTRLLDKLSTTPVVKYAAKPANIGVRASERAYLAFGNKLRADVFDWFVEKMAKQNITPEKDPATFAEFARFIRITTGRGDLGKFGGDQILSTTFFAPRLIASRIQTFDPRFYLSAPKAVRIEAWKNLFAMAGVVSGALAFGKWMGADVESDPRSADFGKMKFGNLRIDSMGGYQQFIRLAWQLAAGQRKTASGQIKELNNEYPNPESRATVVGRFLSQKLAPVPSLAVAALAGKDLKGEEFKLGREVTERMTPLYLNDAYDALKDKNLAALVGIIPAFYGVGFQYYKPTIKYTPGSAIDRMARERELRSSRGQSTLLGR